MCWKSIPVITRLPQRLQMHRVRFYADLRKLLHVKQGERGLRQSDALFQHVENLPKLLEEALADDRARRIAAVACSDRPRPQEGSYMPWYQSRNRIWTSRGSGATGAIFYLFPSGRTH